MARCSVLYAFCVTCVFSAITVAAETTLSKDGRTSYVVVTSADPSPEEATAAAWLSETLARVVGAPFPIRNEDAADLPKTQLLVGDTKAARDAGVDRAALPAEQWTIKTVGESIVLAGGRPRGTIYAVTEFLETYAGVLMLDPFTEVVPSRPTFSVTNLDRTGRPAFPIRALFSGFPYGYPAGGGALTEKFRVWNRNVIDGRPASGDYERMIPTGVHSFGNFISSKEFAATHPEYFGMDASGKRVTDDMGSPQMWTQLCVTNAEVRRLVVERSRKFLREDREAAKKEGREPARILTLSQNDNTTNLCLCPECKAQSDREASECGALLDFINHVARELKTEFPDVRVQTDAYNFTLKAPRDVRPDDNVLVRFCDNYGMSDYTRPLADPLNAKTMGMFREWQEKKCQLGVWDYWRLFQQHPPGMFAPASNIVALYQDLPLFRQAGVEMMTVECEDVFGAGINDDPTSVDMQSFMPTRTWVGLKLMDDPQRDVKQLLDTFFGGYYGPAAKPMRKLLNLIENRQVAAKTRTVDVQRQTWLREICDAEFFAQAYPLLDEALQAVADDPARRVHVQRERIVVDSALLWTEGLIRKQAASLKNPESAALPPRAEILARHREDWKAYLATVFDETGQKLAWPFIETGLTLAEKLRPDDVEVERTALAIAKSEAKLDGRLLEPFWRKARTGRLLPRDPSLPNDSATIYRFAWTPDALWVGIEQPTDLTAASLGFAIQHADLKNMQVAFYAPRREGEVPLNVYFHEFGQDGYLKVVKDRKSQSTAMAHESKAKTTLEMRIAWSDLLLDAKTAKPIDATSVFVFNVESYAKPDANVPSHIASPWLIGRSPTWHSGYFQTLRLAPK